MMQKVSFNDFSNSRFLRLSLNLRVTKVEWYLVKGYWHIETAHVFSKSGHQIFTFDQTRLGCVNITRICYKNVGFMFIYYI